MDVLSETAVAPDPFTQFHSWYAEARSAIGDAADAMVLATADASGLPSARVVLLRGHDERGFRFFTNLASRKGRELAANPRAAVVFHWPALHRQVRATGIVVLVPDAEADEYWRARPRASQLSGWASQQSEPVGSRHELERAAADVAARVGDHDVERPELWGGYRLVPDVIEFWLHRDDRLHDRVEYRRADESWCIRRLQP